MTAADPAAIERRLLDLAPVLDYGLETFLRLLRVEFTDEVPTAAVPLGRSPRLLLNPRFVAEHCPRDEDLLALVLHEIHHVLLGHTRLYPRVTPAQNIAFDAVINAMICRRWPEPERTAFFRRTNPADHVPACLLRPPEGFPGRPRYPASLPRRFRELLDDLYYTNTGTFHEVYEAVVQALPELRVVVGLAGDAPGGEQGSGERPQPGSGAPVLLGNHDGDERGLEATDDPELFEVVRRIVERWPQPPDPRVGRSLAEALQERRVEPRLTPAARVLRRAILAAARGGGRRLRGRPEPRPQRVQSALPSRDRRAFLQRSLGLEPLLYDRRLPGRPRRAGIRPVAVYVDVSGSVEAFVPELVGAVRAVRDLVRPEVYTFSTRVVPTRIERLVEGRYTTTGGTSGAAVAAHIDRTRPDAAVVLTDGYVGPIPEHHHAACRRARLQVVLTPGGWRGDLESVAHAFHDLEDLR